MTQTATRFVGPLSFETISGADVVTELGAQGGVIGHLELAVADCVVVAPATANILAKMAQGVADDAVSTILAACEGPVVVAPAMNTKMLLADAAQRNLEVLRGRGVTVLEAAEGELAQPGEEEAGWGRMREPQEIAEAVAAEVVASRTLEGVGVLISGGPTREPVDAVRFLSNPATGRMAIALARAARNRGARVALVLGPTHLFPPRGVDVVRIETAAEMREAMLARAAEARVIITAAAVSDQRAAEPVPGKRKKGEYGDSIKVVANPDILAELSAARAPGQFLVGFAAETENLEEEARRKLAEKGLDLIVGNYIGRERGGFGDEMNQAILVDRTGMATETPLVSKDMLARAVLDRVEALLGKDDA